MYLIKHMESIKQIEKNLDDVINLMWFNTNESKEMTNPITPSALDYLHKDPSYLQLNFIEINEKSKLIAESSSFVQWILNLNVTEVRLVE